MRYGKHNPRQVVEAPTSSARTLLLPHSHRDLRTAVLIAAVLVFNAFDWGFTQSQLDRGDFIESNPIAARFVNAPGGLAAYKTLLAGAGLAVLFVLRRHGVSEVGAWTLAAAYAGLMVWWQVYLGYVEWCTTYGGALLSGGPL